MQTTPSRHHADAKVDRFSLSQLLLVLIIGSAVSLLGFNYYHALNCPDNNPDATEASIEALSHRLAYSEALVKSNAATMERLLNDMEDDLAPIGKETRDKLHKRAISEAVTLALRLSDLPVPPKPWDFEDEHGIVYENDEDDKRDDKDKEGWADDYGTAKDSTEGEGDGGGGGGGGKGKDNGKGKGEKKQYGRGHDDYVGGGDDANRGDDPIEGSYQQQPDPWNKDVFGGVSSRNDDKQATFTDGLSDKSNDKKRKRHKKSGEGDEADGGGDEGTDDYDDPGEEGAEGKADTFRDNLSDADARHICSDWRTEHNVVVSVSWGSLPFQLQQKWMQYACDYLLS